MHAHVQEHFEGMGDTADLIVLGAYFGTGSKGGKMSTFLMGCYDEDCGKFRTVVKVLSLLFVLTIRSEMGLRIVK